MQGLHSERTGALIIRIWVDRDARAQLRARITRTLDVASGEEVSTAATTVEQIEAVVRDWLDSYVSSGKAHE